VKALRFSPAAQADLETIWDYSAAHWGADQADCYIDDIRDACLKVASGESTGRPVDVRPDYLKIAAGSHRIYARDHGDHLAIIRILHARQDVERNLGND
jgi:toxin ParE1/3/4